MPFGVDAEHGMSAHLPNSQVVCSELHSYRKCPAYGPASLWQVQQALEAGRCRL